MPPHECDEAAPGIPAPAITNQSTSPGRASAKNERNHDTETPPIATAAAPATIPHTPPFEQPTREEVRR
jgi:hypothetical protein